MKLKTMTSVAAVAFGLAATAHTSSAVMIMGDISLDGGYIVDTGNVNTANAFLSFSNVEVQASSGDFAGTDGTAVVQTPFTFDPFGGSVAPYLWSFSFGPQTYTFDLTAISSVSQPGDNSLKIIGTGLFSISGGATMYEDTPGSWTFTAQQGTSSTPTFSFSSSNSATPVPDGGTSVALLGLSILGLHGVRKLSAKRAS